jgi:hypothetical protein
MLNDKIIDEVLTKSSNRRRLLQKLGMASATTVAAGTMSVQRSAADPAIPSATDVVQFALNLEYLEAEFYSIATTGLTLEQRGVDLSGQGNSGPTRTSFGRVNFGNNLMFTGSVAQYIAADEMNHVLLLRSALRSNGVQPIAKPEINLDALAATGASLATEQGFLLLARIFEDIGESAYAGSAQYLSGSPYLTTAARITAVEGEHVANIRLQIARLAIASPAIDPADVVPPPSGSNYFTTNVSNGLVPIRTPGEVLFLAYGNQANATSGGFFPAGVNGAFVTSTQQATSANLT